MRDVRHDLRQLGYEVRDKPDGFRLVLPLFLSLDVSISDNELKTRAISGKMSRAGATSLNLGTMALIPLLFVFLGSGPATSWLSEFATWLRYLFVIAAIWEVLRFVVSEVAILRVELLASHHAAD